jgi:hypothetical protein
MSRLLVSCRFAPCSETDALKVRHAADVAELDGTWRESYAPDCWLAGGQNAEVQFGHDTEAIGQVVVVAARGAWHFADLVVDTDDPAALERIKVGAPVSLGGRMINRDEDIDLRLRRVTLAQLQHIAIARPGELARLAGAKITSVTASKTKPRSASVDWRSSVPTGWECLLENGYEPELGVELLVGNTKTASHRFDGERFVALPTARLVA